MNTKFVFAILILGVVIQRLSELRLSQRHVKHLLNHGGREHSSNKLVWVKVLQITWLIAMVVEVWGFNRPFISSLAAIAFLLLLVGQFLRYFSMQALGERWTLPLVTLPNEPSVNSGIYHYMRHPNWLGVILEIVALPLFHTAYWTAIGCSMLNLALMVQRIKTEEKALTVDNDYLSYLGTRPRFFPVFRLDRDSDHSNSV